MNIYLELVCEYIYLLIIWYIPGIDLSGNVRLTVYSCSPCICPVSTSCVLSCSTYSFSWPDAHLPPVKQHGVPGPLRRRQAGGGSPGSQHDLAVGAEQRQDHGGQEQTVKHAVLVVDGPVAEQEAVVAENRGMEETGGLAEDGDKEVRDRRSGGEGEDEDDEDEGAGHGAHLAVAQGEADGEEALQRHACQDERGGAGGEDRRHHLRTGDRFSVRKYTNSRHTEIKSQFFFCTPNLN